MPARSRVFGTSTGRQEDEREVASGRYVCIEKAPPAANLRVRIGREGPYVPVSKGWRRSTPDEEPIFLAWDTLGDVLGTSVSEKDPPPDIAVFISSDPADAVDVPVSPDALESEVRIAATANGSGNADFACSFIDYIKNDGANDIVFNFHRAAGAGGDGDWTLKAGESRGGIALITRALYWTAAAATPFRAIGLR